MKEVIKLKFPEQNENRMTIEIFILCKVWRNSPHRVKVTLLIQELLKDLLKVAWLKEVTTKTLVKVWYWWWINSFFSKALSPSYKVDRSDVSLFFLFLRVSKSCLAERNTSIRIFSLTCLMITANLPCTCCTHAYTVSKNRSSMVFVFNLYHSGLTQQTTNWRYFCSFFPENRIDISCKLSPFVSADYFTQSAKD